MKKLISYMLVFVLGFATCAYTLRAMYGPPGGRSAGILTTTASHRPTPPIAVDGDNPVATAAAKVEKSVVNIDTEGHVSQGWGLPDLFGMGPPRDAAPRGQASGVIIREDGYILTNNHVVANTSKVRVTLFDQKQYTAEIVGRDPKTDLAVIKIPAKGLTPATFADSGNLQAGDWVIAVGNALGLGTTVTVGVVSATERGRLNIEGTILENAIQTDAAINRGNSGGALADTNGDIVGINTAIASTSPGGGSIGIGFAVPSNSARWVAEQLVQRGKVSRPWIGIMYRVIDDNLRTELAAAGEPVPPVDGALVADVMRNSPAERAGLRPYDVITEINGQKVTDDRTIAQEVTKVSVGDVVDLTVWQAQTKKSATISVKTGEMPADL